MSFGSLEFRPTKRGCHCKVCSKVIEGKAIYFRPSFGHADPVHICKDCLKRMGEMVINDEEEALPQEIAIGGF